MEQAFMILFNKMTLLNSTYLFTDCHTVMIFSAQKGGNEPSSGSLIPVVLSTGCNEDNILKILSLISENQCRTVSELDYPSRLLPQLNLDRFTNDFGKSIKKLSS